MKSKETSLKSITNFISEAGLLKYTQRSGWSVLGIKNCESVAEHSFRCAVIGFLLSDMEGASVEKVMLMALFNDIHEARITDLHKMATRYLDLKKAEDQAFTEQISKLPKSIKGKLSSIHKEYIRQKSLESIIARDADILECLIQAREYQLHGYLQAKKFMRKAPLHLKTKSAKRLWRWAKEHDLGNWWIKLSDFKR